MSTREVFIKAVQAAADIPEPVRAHAQNVKEVKEGVMTQSYLDFLLRESRDNPRGPKWENLMKRRYANMSPYLGARAADALIELEEWSYYVIVDIESQAVIHWE